MPDFTLCMNADCTNRRTCRRGCTMPDPLHQSFSLFKPDQSTGWCDQFVAVGRGEGAADVQIR
jgi:hypothetical protein